MSEQAYGTLESDSGRHRLRYERRLAHPPQKVWRALTEPSELLAWFPCAVEGERRLGARLRFVFKGEEGPPDQGTITEWDPPRSLAFTWGTEVLRFELRPTDGGCLLIFTHAFDERAKAARDATGWHVCLDALQASLTGDVSPTIWSNERGAAVYAEYAARIGFGDFPAFLKQPGNRVAPAPGLPQGAEGYLFDGEGGVQVLFAQAGVDTDIPEHILDFDEHVIVLEGTYTLRIGSENEIRVERGQELVVPKGGKVSGRLTAGTRTIHAFGGRNLRRA
jgi:uncharacterized protein YndB with AHSA1/START domain